VIIAAALAPDGQIGHSWGKAQAVAVGRVEGAALVAWEVHEVGWDHLHEQGSEGSHHARVVTFLRTHAVEAVLAEHVGAGMRRMLGSMGIRLVEHAQGDARAAMLAAAGHPPHDRP
jgi:predicted Fe-Mo cluster-binding NifX family protein